MMITPDVILVGTDGSQNANAAVRWAAVEAECRNGSLRVVHASEERGGTLPVLPDVGLVEVNRNHAEEIATCSGRSG